MSASESTVMHETVSKAQIIAAKIALDAARRLGDELRVDLAEENMNNLLDRYHTYHALQTEGVS